MSKLNNKKNTNSLYDSYIIASF